MVKCGHMGQSRAMNKPEVHTEHEHANTHTRTGRTDNLKPSLSIIKLLLSQPLAMYNTDNIPLQTEHTIYRGASKQVHYHTVT